MSDGTEADVQALLGDVVAFTALPSLWVGASVATIAASLASALDRALAVDAIAVILRAERGLVEARQGDASLLDADVAAWRASEPVSAGTLEIGVGPLGARGVILLRGPPLSKGRGLLARLAANQADTALREAALDHQVGATREQLARLEKLSALGQLVSGVAHELRTPLTYANNHLHLALARLARSRQLPREHRLALEASLTEAIGAHERIDRTVRTLRMLSSPHAPTRASFAFSEAVGEAIRLFTLTHVGAVEVVASLDAEGTVRADRGQLQQVVLNLLQNAAEALPRGGRVEVRTLDEASRAILVVEDDGPGIPEDVRARIFDPFFTTKEGGTGLGLSIVRRIVEEHGATISVGEVPGGGACFEVSFPHEVQTAAPSLASLSSRSDRRPL